MSAAERREAILWVLNTRRRDKIANLAAEFGVSEQTVRSDIGALSCSYPIVTRRGRYGGGVEMVAERAAQQPGHRQRPGQRARPR